MVPYVVGGCAVVCIECEYPERVTEINAGVGEGGCVVR